MECQPPPLNQLAAPFLAFFDAPDVVNPFWQEMRRRNLYKGGVFLPDFYEQSAAARFAAVADRQTGSSFSAVGWPRLVRAGLGVDGHLRAARALPAHPFQEHELPLDLDFLIPRVCQQPITKLRRQTLKAWKCRSAVAEVAGNVAQGSNSGPRRERGHVVVFLHSHSVAGRHTAWAFNHRFWSRWARGRRACFSTKHSCSSPGTS